jgi:hypothetical protein
LTADSRRKAITQKDVEVEDRDQLLKISADSLSSSLKQWLTKENVDANCKWMRKKYPDEHSFF